MKKSKLYTKTGDSGETSLVDGSRVLKSSSRISLYGEVDEFNSILGVVNSYLDSSEGSFQLIASIIIKIQNQLFNIGSRLACESDKWDIYKLPVVRFEVLNDIEKAIDEIDSTLPFLKNFILPGGSKESSYLHLARTSCRKVERLLVEFSKENDIPEHSLVLLNRISDFLFVAARFVNSELAINDKIWEP